MRIRPRQQLLDVWKAAARVAYQPDPQTRRKRWVTGGQHGSNSIADAQQLLVFILPAADIPSFAIHNPDQTNDDVARALANFGVPHEIPNVLLKQVAEYLRKFTKKDGTPDFSGGSYLNSADEKTAPTEVQLAFDVVDSYAASITLCLSTLTVIRGYREAVRENPTQMKFLQDLQDAASRRLTAAMVGMLRSFTVNVFRTHEPNGVEVLKIINQAGQQEEQLVSELRNKLTDVRANLRRITLGSGQIRAQAAELQESNTLFELGWSWGIIKNAPDITILEDFRPVPQIGTQRPGYAYDAPYLYFTVVALDALNELFTDRTRQYGLLDEAQQRLADALRIRYDLTQRYWATIASYTSTPRWPLEDIPWRTVDGVESDYYTLMVSSIAARRIADRSENPVADLTKMVRIVSELANRGRLTRRPVLDDPAMELHHPGFKVELELTEEVGPPLVWNTTDFAALLLKRCIRTSALITDIPTRNRMVNVVDQVWDHVQHRRLRGGDGQGLWDQPSNVFPGIGGDYKGASWHHTLRIVEALVQAADLVQDHPLRSDTMLLMGHELLHEAEHLFDQELFAVDQTLLNATMEYPARGEHAHLDALRSAGIDSFRDELHSLEDELDQAREIIEDRPGTAVAILNEVLVRLDRLARIRANAALHAGSRTL